MEVVESLKETPEEAAQFEAMLHEQPPPETKVEEKPPEQKAEEPPKQEEQPKEPPKEQTKAEEKPVRLVPHQALHEERERRKQLEQRLAALEKTQQPQPTAEGQEPDENTDPIGSIAWLKAKLAAKEQAEEDARNQHAYFQDLGQKVQTRVNAYAAEHPEYKEQVQFLREFRVRELVEGLGYPPEMAVQQVQQEEIALGKQAIDNDLDPGAMVAKLATVRGWKPKEADPAPQAAAQPSKEAEEKIDRLARGQKAAMSSSGSGGGAPDDEMTVEKLLSLQGEAFDKAFAKHGKRLMGG